MKRFIPILICFFLAVSAKSQIRPSDSLYLWVDFKEDKILIHIPDQYINYRTQWPALPKYVRVNETLMLVPNLPEKPKLLSILTDELNASNPSSKDEQLKYLCKLVLLLLYSDNDLNYFAEKYQQELDRLTQKSLVKSEVALVKKWVEMIKKLDQVLHNRYKI
ncbi:MAG: hypothetical protein WCQ70_10150 [Lentimicrobiaceae bacterium]